MSGPTTGRWLAFPGRNGGPIQRRETGASISNDGINVEQSGQGRLVKTGGCRYQSKGLLLRNLYSLLPVANGPSRYKKFPC